MPERIRYGAPVALAKPLIAVAATTVTKWFKNGTRPLRIDLVRLIVPATGFTADAVNYVTMQLRHGAGPTVAALWSSQTGQQGAVAANTFVDMVKQADGALVIPALAEVDINQIKAGTQNFPACEVQIFGRLA